jgi:hypothetical protein
MSAIRDEQNHAWIRAGMFLLISICFGLLAVWLLAGSAWVYFKHRRKMAGRAAAVGRVIELTGITTDDNPARLIRPAVLFTAASGENIRFTSKYVSGRPVKYDVGQSVNVRYNPAEPLQAEIDPALNRWMIPLALAIMGAAAGCAALALLGVYVLGQPSISP